MLFNVPQFTDIEDKIVGPLTAKQLGWLAAGGVVLLFTWNLLDLQAFIISAIITGIIFGSLAFYRPYNQPLIKFIFSSTIFVVRPKVYIWRRIFDDSMTQKKPVAKKATPKITPKKANQEKIKEISQILDQK